MALFSLIVLISSIFAGSISALVNAATTQNSANVTITNISSDKATVSNNETVNLTVTFQGNSTVQSGEQLVITMPSANGTTGGFHGVKGDIQIDATQNGQTVSNVATAHVEGNTVTITFNDNVSKLTNGFTGSFTFQAKAEKGQAAGDEDGNVSIDTSWPDGTTGPNVTIVPGTNNDQSDVGVGDSSSSSLAPVISTTKLSKIGAQGTDGNINWQIDGQIASTATGEVTLTDTPNPTANVDWSLFRMIMDGKYYSISDLENAGCTFQRDTPVQGGFELTAPDGFLQGKKWTFIYTAKLDSAQVGETFNNSVTMDAPDGQKQSDAVVKIESHGSGEIIGFNTGELTLQKQDGDTNIALAGAQFTLTKDGVEVGTAKTDSSGKVTFDNLSDGTYTVKETQAPTGYQLDDQEYTFTISDGQLTNSTLPSDFIIKNYKEASSSSSSVISSSSSSEESSSVVSSSAVSSSKESSSKISSSAVSSSKESSSVVSSSAVSLSEKSSTVISSSVASSNEKSSAKDTSRKVSSTVSADEKDSETKQDQNETSSTSDSQHVGVVLNNNDKGNGHNQGRGSGTGLPQTGEDLNVLPIVIGFAMLTGVAGAVTFSKKKN